MNNTAYFIGIRHFILEFAFISIGIMQINIVFSDSPNCHAISQP